MKRRFLLAILTVAIAVCYSCEPSCHEQMLSLLQTTRHRVADPRNSFSPETKLPFMDSLLQVPHNTPSQIAYCQFLKANVLLELGREDEAIVLLENLTTIENPSQLRLVLRELAVAQLRAGERTNCIANHAAESCLLPIRGLGLHRDTTGSNRAIALYTRMLEKDTADYESRWLLNLAYMTLGQYPAAVPKRYYMPGMEGDTSVHINPFQDVAGALSLDIHNMAGGSVIEDFDNDGYFDVVTSSMDLSENMHYLKNNADGTFTDLSEQSGLSRFTGGLNMVQADYNNDGFKDILVLRGAWKNNFGEEPNSLLRNNGDGTFTDVTTISGLLSFHPTQTATWNDFNNDGWLDIFIGNETSTNPEEKVHRCELYINNQDGTFREIATKAFADYGYYVKGVTSGDYDHDGWKDIFFSSMSGRRVLLKNLGKKGEEIMFEEVTTAAGVSDYGGNSFTTWMWDYDNDGWLDLLSSDYTFRASLAYYAGAEKLGRNKDENGKVLLYHNNGDGTFTNVTHQTGLNTVVFSMGGNFGDIDNDGYLDMYFGTGNPQYQSLVPNKMFKNMGGSRFADITTSARVGHLQKGHGVSFADLDNDGDEDVYIDMGGAFKGDAYQNSFFLNPGQSNNNWIKMNLVGTTVNRDAIGSQIKVTFRENGVKRSVYRDVNSGGSFGASPLRRQIGIGQATVIDEIEIRWHGSDRVQTFKNVKPNQVLQITEGKDTFETVNLKTINWVLPDQFCFPVAAAN